MQVYDADAKRKLRSMDGHSRRVSSAAWARACLATGGKDHSIVLHDVRAGQNATMRMRWHRADVCGLKVQRLAVFSW